VLAPHPDDESLAAGGLLQVAQEIGVTRRVVIVTDGDNNPWPQRCSEKRWYIGRKERTAWGMRRRAEAKAALTILSVLDTERYFLGWPDGELTSLLLRADPAVVERLRNEIASFRPTLIIVPAMRDRHPDHSALHVLVRIALVDVACSCRILSYDIHGQKTNAPRPDVVELHLTPDQQLRKYRAIAAHTSQMVLSRRRFLRYATAVEIYFDESVNSKNIIIGAVDHHQLHLKLKLPLYRIGTRPRLQLVLESNRHRSFRWEVDFFSLSRVALVKDLLAQQTPKVVTVDYHASWLSLTLPLPASIKITQGFAKLEWGRRNSLFVLDRVGWVWFL